MSWYLPRSLCSAFHQCIRAGDTDGMLSLLAINPLLVNARNGTKKTALMIAATHPDSCQAVLMIELLMENGATLGSRDSRQRHVLLHACKYGASRVVVESLVTWNERRGGRKFRWHGCDIEGLSALIQATKQEDTAVTLFLLDRINISMYAKHNHPFKILMTAINSGNKHHALEIARHEKIRASIQDPEITRYQGSGAPKSEFTISTCTEAAVMLQMVELVQLMNEFNWRKLSRAVWYMVNKVVRQGVKIDQHVPQELLLIGKLFTSDWRWSLVRDLCVARYRGDNEQRNHILADLPDDVFHRIVAFAVPLAFRHPLEFVSRWCKCTDTIVYGECFLHGSYEANRNDYHRLYNYDGTSRCFQ